MKKLLLLLFSILISFNSYGEWKDIAENYDDDIFYIDLDTVKESDGYVYWWYLKDLDEPVAGFMSGITYIQGDCEFPRFKTLSDTFYTEPMGRGEHYSNPTSKEWDYYPPGTVGQMMLDLICEFVVQTPKEKQRIIAEWDDDSSYGASATPEVGETFTADIAGSLSSKSFPPNAYPSGNSWKCNIGYERYNNGCRPEVVEEQQKKNQLEVERAAEKLAFEKEQYNRLLTEAVQAEEDLARQLIIEDQLNTLKSAYVNNIAARVYSLWNFRGAQKGWGCEVYVLQDVDGNIQAVDVQNCTLDDSSQARAFKDSIERAVYKASPLPAAPDDAVFSRELLFYFRAN